MLAVLTRAACAGAGSLLQLFVLCLSFFKNRHIRIGVLPQCEEILIRGPRLRRVSGKYACPAQSELGQRMFRGRGGNPSMVDDLLEFCRGLGSALGLQVYQTPNVDRKQPLDCAQLIWRCCLKRRYSRLGSLAIQSSQSLRARDPYTVQKCVIWEALAQVLGDRLGAARVADC